MLNALDILLFIFHTIIVLFNLFGWVFRRTRKLHLVVMGLTLFAWLVIGLYVGTIGYCPLTDWHWDIKRELGERNLPYSFIKYLIDHSLGINANPKYVDVLTATGLVFALICALYVNFLQEKMSRLFHTQDQTNQ